MTLNRPLTDEELRQLLRERDERLDPANRPDNAEVDNTPREWDYEHNDFADSLVNGRARPVPDMTGQGPKVERPEALRVFGTIMVLVCCFFLWLTWAFFSKSFTDYDDVKLTAAKAGLSVPQRADVKLRGMIVGTVRDIRVDNGQVVMTLGMDPKLIDRVPRNVRAEIVPKTLFGEKYISLVPTGAGTTEHLRAGDAINNAVVPIEFEKFFNDVYPLLTAVPPDKVAYTLTALANTLEGRGDELGQTLVDTNDYLTKLSPETQQAVADLIKLGQVSDTYAGDMNEFGELLRNSAKVSRTVTDKKKELHKLFDQTDKLAVVLRDFFAVSGDDIVLTMRNSRQPLKIGAQYSSVFPCLFKGLDYFLRNDMDSSLKNGTLHIDLVMIPRQPTVYDIATERPTIPAHSVIDAQAFADPNNHGHDADGTPSGLGTICDELNKAAAGHPRTHETPLSNPAAYWKLFGIRNSHNGKLRTDADYNRAVAASSDSSGIDSPAQRAVLNGITGGLTGVKRTEVPDVASLLLSPVVRGAAIEVSGR